LRQKESGLLKPRSLSVPCVVPIFPLFSGLLVLEFLQLPVGVNHPPDYDSLENQSEADENSFYEHVIHLHYEAGK